jgi:hypothetical protein
MSGITPPNPPEGKVVPFPGTDDARRLPEQERAIETGGRPPHPPSMDIGDRLARVESGLDWIKVILTLIGAVMIGGFTFFGVRFDRLDAKIEAQTQRLDAKIEAIPQRLSEEFRAMRAEMSAQTSAIANAITATHQAPPPAPQIIIVPTPQPSPAPAPAPEAPKP